MLSTGYGLPRGNEVSTSCSQPKWRSAWHWLVTCTFLCFRSAGDHWGLVGAFAVERCLKACITLSCSRFNVAACCTTPLWNSCNFSSQIYSSTRNTQIYFRIKKALTEVLAAIYAGISNREDRVWIWTLHRKNLQRLFCWISYQICRFSFFYMQSPRVYSFLWMSWAWQLFPCYLPRSATTFQLNSVWNFSRRVHSCISIRQDQKTMNTFTPFRRWATARASMQFALFFSFFPVFF